MYLFHCETCLSICEVRGYKHYHVLDTDATTGNGALCAKYLDKAVEIGRSLPKERPSLTLPITHGNLVELSFCNVTMDC